MRACVWGCIRVFKDFFKLGSDSCLAVLIVSRVGVAEKQRVRFRAFSG